MQPGVPSNVPCGTPWRPTEGRPEDDAVALCLPAAWSVYFWRAAEQHETLSGAAPTSSVVAQWEHQFRLLNAGQIIDLAAQWEAPSGGAVDNPKAPARGWVGGLRGSTAALMMTTSWTAAAGLWFVGDVLMAAVLAVPVGTMLPLGLWLGPRLRTKIVPAWRHRQAGPPSSDTTREA